MILDSYFPVAISISVSYTHLKAIASKKFMNCFTSLLFVLFFRCIKFPPSPMFKNAQMCIRDSAHTALIEQNIQGFENQMFFVIDHIIDRLEKEPKLLQFISKNLSWGIFKNA